VTLHALRTGHHICLLTGGESFFPALLDAIDSSQHEVRLETYIFNFDTTGERVAAALVRAAGRGVRVFLMMDGIGSAPVPVLWQQQFSAAQVQWHRFSPLGHFGLLVPGRWRRLHRKLCVVDGRVAFCGGINIIDDWFDPVYGQMDSPRFDFSVRVVGPLVADVHAAMSRFWRHVLLTTQIERLAFEEIRQTWETSGNGFSGEQIDGTRSVSSPSAGTRAALALRDNLRNRTRIERVYRKAIAGARHEVIIANAYFLPGLKLRRALIHAARRGVHVRLLLQGRYEYFMQYHAARPVIQSLLNAGIEIYEYRAGFLHAKVAIVDGNWATVGSSNLDPLSLLLAREANILVEDATFARELRDKVQVAMVRDSVLLNTLHYADRPWWQYLLDWLAYSLMRAALLLTFSRY
jgi:cardiolipin synthase